MSGGTRRGPSYVFFRRSRTALGYVLRRWVGPDTGLVWAWVGSGARGGSGAYMDRVAKTEHNQHVLSFIYSRSAMSLRVLFRYLARVCLDSGLLHRSTGICLAIPTAFVGVGGLGSEPLWSEVSHLRPWFLFFFSSSYPLDGGGEGGVDSGGQPVELQIWSDGVACYARPGLFGRGRHLPASKKTTITFWRICIVDSP